MPIYEYRCASCGFQKEYLQKVGAPILSDCPECHKHTFGKMLTSAGFQLKGGGWYATDFKNSGGRPVAKTEDKSAGKAENKTAVASESKSEGKSEGKGDSKTEAKPAAVVAPAAAASTAKAE